LPLDGEEDLNDDDDFIDDPFEEIFDEVEDEEIEIIINEDGIEIIFEESVALLQ